MKRSGRIGRRVEVFEDDELCVVDVEIGELFTLSLGPPAPVAEEAVLVRMITSRADIARAERIKHPAAEINPVPNLVRDGAGELPITDRLRSQFVNVAPSCVLHSEAIAPQTVELSLPLRGYGPSEPDPWSSEVDRVNHDHRADVATKVNAPPDAPPGRTEDLLFASRLTEYHQPQTLDIAGRQLRQHVTHRARAAHMLVAGKQTLCNHGDRSCVNIVHLDR
jgi:hypothetical protein